MRIKVTWCIYVNTWFFLNVWTQISHNSLKTGLFKSKRPDQIRTEQKLPDQTRIDKTRQDKTRQDKTRRREREEKGTNNPRETNRQRLVRRRLMKAAWGIRPRWSACDLRVTFKEGQDCFHGRRRHFRRILRWQGRITLPVDILFIEETSFNPSSIGRCLRGGRCVRFPFNLWTNNPREKNRHLLLYCRGVKVLYFGIVSVWINKE